MMPINPQEHRARVSPVGQILKRVTSRPSARQPDPVEEDRRLIARLRALDNAAFETLLDRFEQPLYRFFYYAHRDHERAQDQCAETFANLVSAIHKMHNDADSLRALVFGVARNVLRRGWREKPLYPASDLELERLVARQPDAFQSALDRQRYERAMSAIEQFGDPVRQVLLLRFVEELSLEEIAEALELPLGTVKSHIFRSRRRLQSTLRDEDA